MPRLPHLRVIIEAEPNSGAWNMAVDEALLETAISSDVATLRLYRWSEPTISLGYFQKSADLIEDPHLSQLPAVRRLTGGGAILHDDELTYSVTLPSSQDLFGQPEQLYDIVHQAIALSLQQCGFPAVFRGATLKRSEEPLLCFLRRDSHDITVDGYKVLGSAQRRRRGSILQHGSLIRRASRLAKQLPGLSDLCNSSLPENFSERLAKQIADTISESWTRGSIDPPEIALASNLCDQQTRNVRNR